MNALIIMANVGAITLTACMVSNKDPFKPLYVTCLSCLLMFVVI